MMRLCLDTLFHQRSWLGLFTLVGAMAVPAWATEPVASQPRHLERRDDRIPVVDLWATFPQGTASDPKEWPGLSETWVDWMRTRLPREVDSQGARWVHHVDLHQLRIGIHGIAESAHSQLALLKNVLIDHPLPSETEWAQWMHRVRVRQESARQEGRVPQDLAGPFFQTLLAQDSRYARGFGFSGLGMSEATRLPSRRVLGAWLKTVLRPESLILVTLGRTEDHQKNALSLTQAVQETFSASQLLQRWNQAWSSLPEPPSGSDTPRATGTACDDAPPHPAAVKPSLVGNSASYHVFRYSSKNSPVPAEHASTTLRMGVRSAPMDHPDMPLLELAALVLAGSYQSRLSKRLREELPLVFSAEGGFWFEPGFGAWSFSASATAAQLPTLLRLIETTWSEAVGPVPKHPLTEDEINRARDRLLGGLPLLAATLEAQAQRDLLALQFGLVQWTVPSPDWNLPWTARKTRIQSANASGVQAAVQRWWGSSSARAIWFLSGPAAAFPKKSPRAWTQAEVVKRLQNCGGAHVSTP